MKLHVGSRGLLFLGALHGAVADHVHSLLWWQMPSEATSLQPHADPGKRGLWILRHRSVAVIRTLDHAGVD